jgi:hypothetical protein
MTEEIPSARPTFPQPTPAEDIPEDAPSLVPAAPPGGQVAETAPPEAEPFRLPDTVIEARAALTVAEDTLAAHHRNPEFVAMGASGERLASALILVRQARDRFEEWIAATF